MIVYEEYGNGPCPRSGCLLTPVPNGGVLLGGGYSKETAKKEEENGVTHTDMFLLTPERFPKVEVSLVFCLRQMGDLRRYYADFPWNDYCFLVRDPSVCAERIIEVIVSGMEAYIPQSFS
ncbi:Kelch domain-containing protein 4 [Portunus trituberculatus]|uniref:Kelch domain-containing protein 4 n=1 Tax=Portunus trituberculatus TaxID=210409 RepID=A0A5B7FBG5_PORTR|nr:Kelch domain-containing protein 4 [Portunus trituberculatus]